MQEYEYEELIVEMYSALVFVSLKDPVGEVTALEQLRCRLDPGLHSKLVDLINKRMLATQAVQKTLDSFTITNS